MSIFKYSVKFVLQQTATPSKETPLRCFVRFNNTRCVFASGALIEPRFWNLKSQEPRSSVANSNATKVSKQLKDVRLAVDIAFDHLTKLHGEYPEPDQLKAIILQVLASGGIIPGQEKKTSDLFKYIGQLIADTEMGKRVKAKGERYTSGTVRHYNSAFGVLKDFATYKGKSTFKFNDVNLAFYFDLRDYMYRVRKLSDNYFGIVIKFLKTCMNESREDKYHSNDEYTSKRFVKVSVDVENIYLSQEQLNILFNHDFSDKPRLARARDLFLIGCWTGLRFSDFTNIKERNVTGDFIEIKTQKTSESVAIPIHPVVRTIMDRYKGVTANSLPPSISNVKLNEYIKDAAKEAGLTNIVQVHKHKAGGEYSLSEPLYKLISTHTARRAFASNMFRMGVPSIVIMAVTGHRTEKAFMKYIKVTPREKAEIMKEIWTRQAMKVV